VSVSLTDEVRRNVLTVPLTSLISIGANRFAVIAHEGSRTRQVVVTPGLAAEGYVEVEGEGLREGMQVEAPE
jgi:multidrug efflux pump subunit AcrA (membrane-fusion protein)